MFDVGDLVVCVDDSLPAYGAQPIKLLVNGQYYRVSSLGNAPNGEPTMLVDGEPPHKLERGFITGWRRDRFRKIDAPDTEVSRLIRACKPVREGQPA